MVIEMIFKRGVKNVRKITKEEVMDALRKVVDPEIGIDIVSLGLVYDVNVDENNNVKINMTTTIPGCPLANVMLMDARWKVSEIPDIGEVDVNLVWDPPWTPDRIDPEIKKKLGIK